MATKKKDFLRILCSLISIIFGIRVSAAKLTEKRISESTVIGTIVFTLPRIADKRLGYSLYKYGDPAANNHFFVSPDGEIKLKSRLEFKVGQDNSVLLIVVLRNKDVSYGGEAHTVKFVIEDANNHPPEFDKSLYYGHVEEGMPPGTVVSGLEDCFATDKDSSGISGYKIDAGNNNNEFRLETSKRGDIKLVVIRTNKKLDRDEMGHSPTLDLSILASDGGEGVNQKFKKTVVRIMITDKNDNPPVFIHVNWQNTVQENAQIMTSVLKVSASDNDEGQNKELYYHFKEPSDDFAINPATGVISVASSLNGNIKNLYEMIVIAQDKAIQNPLTAEAFVKIQVLNVPNYPANKVYGGRNSPPSFPKSVHVVTVRRDLPVFSTVFFVPATDVDSYGPLSKLEYSISGNNADIFSISKKSGVVTLSKSLNSVKSADSIQLTVFAMDGARERASMDVEIKIQPFDTNLYSPVFFPSTVSLTIPQNTPVNSEIGFTARATDTDGPNTDNGKITYNIVDGSGIGRFIIDKNTGRITTRVIFKELDTYSLYVRAQDHGKYRKTGMLYLRITILANENVSPVLTRAMYTARIPENLPANTFVSAVFAESLTSTKPVNYYVRNSREVTSMAIDSDTGVITTTMPLNYEMVQAVLLEISAIVKDQTESANAMVSVEVVNANNKPPVFTRSSLTVNVAENSGHIPSLVCLFATDEDDGPIFYTITSGNIGNVFSIDQNTGKILILY